MAGLPHTRLHDLRHSYASAALAAGMPVKVVSDRLGHGNVGITSDLYIHVPASGMYRCARNSRRSDGT